MMERGRLRQRICEMLRASLRSTCSITSRNVAESVQEPVFVTRRHTGDDGDDLLQGLDRSLSLPPPSLQPALRHHRGHALAAGSPRLSVDCRCRSATQTRASLKKGKKKELRVSEIGVSYEAGGDGEGRTCPPASPVSPSYYCFKQMREELDREERRIASKKKKEKEGAKGKRKLLSNSYGFTTSSSENSDNDAAGNFFSSDEAGGAPREMALSKERDAEAEVLFSSRSFSSDSSEFYYHHPSRRHSSRRKKKASQRQQKPRRGDNRRQHGGGDGFKPIVSISSSSSSSHTRTNEEAAAAAVLGEEEVEVAREGFAVEKQSSDPYADFRSSMLEMIVEKQLFGAREMEHLLRCYLSLNSPSHHPTIIDVFSEIWETLFSI